MRTKEREDYLKTIYQLQRQSGSVRTTDIARSLSVEPASVTGVLKRLAELELVLYRPYHGVELTESGLQVALEIIRNHRLIELYLVEVLGFRWDEVHDEAERLEHAVSQRFIDRIEAALGYPEVDPHGSPIPARDGSLRRPPEMPLSALKRQQPSSVTRVVDEDGEMLRYLASHGIHPGVAIVVLEGSAGSGTLRVRIGDQEQEIEAQVVRSVFVKDPDIITDL